MRELDPDLSLGYLYLPHIQSFVTPDATIRAHCPFYQTAGAHPEQVAEAHRLGKYVFVYTVNDEPGMRLMAEAAVDGMVTDRPSLLMELLEQSNGNDNPG
jgi:glycerophosphoryl diester phosphodiesterase